MTEFVAEDLIKKNLDVYNKIAKYFSETRQYVWRELKPLAQYVREGDTILDLGCGNGRLYQMFEDFSISYIGIDQSEELLTLARKQFPQGKFLSGSMLAIPLPDRAVDSIFCIAAFQHIPGKTHQLKALSEMKRVLKPGGKLIMTNWNLFGEWGLKQVRAGKYEELGEGDFLVPWRDSEGKVLGDRYYHGFTPDELQSLFEEVGFLVLDQYFVKKDERVDKDTGENIVSIVELAAV